MPDYTEEDPLVPLATAQVTVPAARQSDVNFEEFHATSAPGDRVVLLFGAEGFSLWNGTPIPLDIASADEARTKFNLAEFQSTAGPDGKAFFTVVAQFLTALPRPAHAVVLAERGGSQGSARRFLTAPLVVNMPP